MSPYCTQVPAPIRGRPPSSRPKRSATRIAAACMLLTGHMAFAQTYRAYAWPVESPNHGARTLVTAPHDPVASPFGWHDTNGIAGAEYTTLRGNNAWVFLDVNADNMPDGPGPDGGPSLIFDYPVNLGGAPSTYYEALAVNTFYWTNRLHDIFLRHGFTPARGNMQANNYGQGGIGGDAVKVEVAQGSGLNNVTYALTADGTSPTILQFVWNLTSPKRESSFDAGTTTWAYSILMYNRLTTNCMSQAESPFVGYGDFLGILVTTNFQTATPTTPRGLGTYLLGQPTNGPGARTMPYSTNMSVFTRTYADMPTLPRPYETGSVWAAALWDLTWAMVARYGASNDLLTGNGAENRMLRLSIEAMDQMTCPAGFVTARDAVLQADVSLYGGQNRCMIWTAFARRGMGVSASEGSSNSISDQTPAFNPPVDCDRIFASGFDFG